MNQIGQREHSDRCIVPLRGREVLVQNAESSFQQVDYQNLYGYREGLSARTCTWDFDVKRLPRCCSYISIFSFGKIIVELSIGTSSWIVQSLICPLLTKKRDHLMGDEQRNQHLLDIVGHTPSWDHYLKVTWPLKPRLLFYCWQLVGTATECNSFHVCKVKRVGSDGPR